MFTTQLTFDIQIFDTDCYGVVWHGAYAKWLEMGRVKHLEAMGVTMDPPGQPGGYVFPVTEQRLKYLAPGRMGDLVTLTSTLVPDGFQLKFTQTVTRQADQKMLLDTQTTVVVLDANWRLQRRLPPAILTALGQAKASGEPLVSQPICQVVSG
jgi:acyl-CoA thioester hydrolase